MRKSDDPSVIRVSMASLTEGIPASEVPQYADLLVQASYGRSMTTRVGGYIQKQLNAAFQGLRLDPDPQSDCRTQLFLAVTVDDPREYVYRFYDDPAGGPQALRQITPQAFGEVRGRAVRMRSPLFCGSASGICSRCAGTLYYRVGILTIGLLAGRIGTTLMNGALKAFHDTSLKMTKVEIGAFTREVAPPRRPQGGPEGEDEPPEEDTEFVSADAMPWDPNRGPPGES
jgi:hypothetical protein